MYHYFKFIFLAAINLFIHGPQLTQNLSQAGPQLVREMRIWEQLTNTIIKLSLHVRYYQRLLLLHFVLTLLHIFSRASLLPSLIISVV